MKKIKNLFFYNLAFKRTSTLLLIEKYIKNNFLTENTYRTTEILKKLRNKLLQ